MRPPEPRPQGGGHTFVDTGRRSWKTEGDEQAANSQCGCCSTLRFMGKVPGYERGASCSSWGTFSAFLRFLGLSRFAAVTGITGVIKRHESFFGGGRGQDTSRAGLQRRVVLL